MTFPAALLTWAAAAAAADVAVVGVDLRAVVTLAAGRGPYVSGRRSEEVERSEKECFDRQ